jgi:hypothetical protein
VIRQAISCDICGTEKKQTNHWFVVYDQGGELRVGSWASRNRLRPGSKHLCGQTCLHKMVDEFISKALAMRVQATSQGEAEEEAEEQPQATDASLTSNAAYGEVESSARLIAVSTPPRPPLRMPVELVPAPARAHTEEPAPAAEDPARYTSRTWRAEAWERERERELRAVQRRPEIAARRRSNS